jgi:hypothetical protein
MSIAFDLDKHLAKYSIWYESGVLVPEVHYRLVEDLDHVAASAGVPPIYLTRSMEGVCSQEEIDWFLSNPLSTNSDSAGLVYTSLSFNEERLILLAAAFLRNYINAKIMSLQQVIDVCSKGGSPNCTVLLIPNFYLSRDSGGDISSWKISYILGMMYDRLSKNQLTVIHCETLSAMAASYGDSFSSLINNNYRLVD